MKYIRIYAEGGGNYQETRAVLRQGFTVFFHNLREEVRTKGLELAVVACGSRTSCFQDYENALRTHPTDFNILLVDSETPVYLMPRAHLLKRDNWRFPTHEGNCHLMAQTMEAWLIADIDALSDYYGQRFTASSIPHSQNIEDVEKTRLEECLQRATKHTTKGEYNKLRHGSDLLQRINPAKVRAKAPHCNRLFGTVISEANAT